MASTSDLPGPSGASTTTTSTTTKKKLPWYPPVPPLKPEKKINWVYPYQRPQLLGGIGDDKDTWYQVPYEKPSGVISWYHLPDHTQPRSEKAIFNLAGVLNISRIFYSYLPLSYCVQCSRKQLYIYDLLKPRPDYVDEPPSRLPAAKMPKVSCNKKANKAGQNPKKSHPTVTSGKKRRKKLDQAKLAEAAIAANAEFCRSED